MSLPERKTGVFNQALNRERWLIDEARRLRRGTQYGTDLGFALHDLIVAETSSGVKLTDLEVLKKSFAEQVDRALQSKKQDERLKGLRALMEQGEVTPQKQSQ